METMKKLKLAMVTMLILGAMVVEGKAEQRALDGMLIGAGGGALVGQAIGRDTKATLIGTAVGGVLGLLAGNEMDRGDSGREYGTVQTALYSPPQQPIQAANIWYNHHDSGRDEYRDRHRPSKVCWEEVVRVERRHGGYREEIRTVCRDRGWRDHHRGWWRDDGRWRDRW